MASASRKAKTTRESRHVALSFVLVGDAPPREFRIFAAGKNSSAKGDWVFDEQAARDVMAAYEAHGADVMIDLEHLSVADPDRSVNFDPDARGWAKLELRNGELWAVDVTWTPDGLARLTERRQRYISPCFAFDPDTGRVTEILNIAITALPATDNLEPLIAASRRVQRLTMGEEAPMTQEQFQKIAEALELGSDATVEDVIAVISEMVNKLKSAANGESPEAAAEEEPIAAETAAVPAVAAARRIGAASRALVALSGKKDIGEVVTEIKIWRESHLTLEQERAKLAKDRAILEGGERRRLVAQLVTLNAEIPATAWEDDDATTPAEPWKSMPIEALRARVAKLSQANGGATPPATRTAPRPAPVASARGGKVVSVDGETVELSAREVKICEETKTKLEDYAANKLIRKRDGAAVG